MKVTLDHYRPEPEQQYDTIITHLAQLQIIGDAASYSAVMEIAKRLGFDIDEVHIGEREADIMTAKMTAWDDDGRLVI